MHLRAFAFDLTKGCFCATSGVPISDRGFRFGMHVFETLAVKDARLLLGDLHAALLDEASLTVKFPPPPQGWLQQAKNLAANAPDGVMRIYWTAGDGPPTGPVVTPRLFALLEEMPIPAGPEPEMTDGCFFTFAGNGIPWVKSGNYWPHIQAQQAAITSQSPEVILVDADGWIHSAAMANFYAIINGCIVTPAAGQNVRPGAVRAWLTQHHSIETRALHREELALASECFLTNSRIGIRSLTHIDKFLFPDRSVVRFLWECYLRDVLNGPV